MGHVSRVVLSALVAAVCLASGCASMKTTEWTGHKIDEVIKEFGPPTRTVPTADGQAMYVWDREHSYPQSSWGAGGTVSTTSRRQVTTWSFLVNQERTIVSWHRDEGGMY